jgi:hypothetical protein
VLVHLDVNRTPPNVILGGLLVYDTLVLGGATRLFAGKVNQCAGRGDDST